MREIKFRAWADGKMHYDNFSIEFNGGEMDDMIAYTKSDGKVVTCEDFILMQYIGLKDKNGKEIYEGDIVSYKIYMSAKQKFPVKTMVWIWSEYHCGFSMKIVGGDRYEPPIMIPGEHEIIIIGNIHQNPELLKK